MLLGWGSDGVSLGRRVLGGKSTSQHAGPGAGSRQFGDPLRLGLGLRDPPEAQQETVAGALRVSGSATK